MRHQWRTDAVGAPSSVRLRALSTYDRAERGRTLSTLERGGSAQGSPSVRGGASSVRGGARTPVVCFSAALLLGAALSLLLVGALAAIAARVLAAPTVGATSSIFEAARRPLAAHARRRVPTPSFLEPPLPAEADGPSRGRADAVSELDGAGASPSAAPPLPSPSPSASGPPTFGDEDAVDAVYTWVDSSDPVWRVAVRPVLEAAGLVTPTDVDDADHARGNKFRDWGELRYSMRSLHAYAPWIRNVFVVTAGPTQVPGWLNASHPRVRIVHLDALFDDPAAQLPTLNSYAIESVLHRIPGLSQTYLYLNNDFLVARPLALADFRTPHAYVQYVDWWLTHTPSCGEELGPLYRRVTDAEAAAREAAGGAARAVRAPPAPIPADAYPGCRADVLGWDAVLTLHYWGVRLTRWFAHAPRLHERRVLAAVEATLAEPLAACRRNRLRDGATDVNVHLQYEAARVDAARRGAPGALAVEPRERIGTGGRLSFHMVVFDNGSSRPFYEELHAVMTVGRPLFLAIDDDLKRPAPGLLAYHRERLGHFFQTHWPVAAPWERADRPPPRADPEAFAAAEPPPRYPLPPAAAVAAAERLTPTPPAALPGWTEAAALPAPAGGGGDGSR